MSFKTILLSNLDSGSYLLIGGTVFVLIYIIFKIRSNKKNQQKIFTVHQTIDEEMIAQYLKKHKKLFKNLTEKDYYQKVGVKETDSLQYIEDIYKQKIEKYELTSLDVKYYPDLLKEEALFHEAQLTYCFNQIKALKQEGEK